MQPPTPFPVDAFAAEKDSGAAEAHTELRGLREPDHRLLPARRTLLALGFVEPLEKIEVRLGGHHTDASAVRRAFLEAAPPIPSAERLNFAARGRFATDGGYAANRTHNPRSPVGGVPLSPGLNLTIRLADGELTELDLDAQEKLYERLWNQTQRGSIMAAMKLRDAQTQANAERLVRLTEQESVAFREAMRHVKGD
jgi:hypothetical protein